MEDFFEIYIDLPKAKEPLDSDFYSQMAGMYLWDNGVSGVEERDQETFMNWGIYEAPKADEIRLIASLDISNNIDSFLEDLKAYISELVDDYYAAKITYKVSDGKSWQDEWKKHFKPIKIGSQVIVKPEWEEYTPINDEIIVLINPDMAFGTGHHETTALAIETLQSDILVNFKSEVKDFIDIGTGSGILAITAEKLFENINRIDAIDIDHKALKIAGEHLLLNQTTKINIRFETAPEIDDCYDFVVANIISSVLIELKSDILRLCKKGGWILLSGVQKKEISVFKEHFLSNEILLVDEKDRGDWSSLLYKRL
ncbi:50S ribosomal protein L11 methyltransferase [bacterium]|nr:50S ribosomal protein L11 methyltransferase [bacterium]